MNQKNRRSAPKDIAATLLVTAIFLLPFTVFAGRRYETPNREMTLAEKKIGSVFRGCIGFHCLEEAPTMSVSFAVSEEPCGRGDETSLPVELDGDGYLCATLSTNAREGVLLIGRGSGGTEACPAEKDDSLEYSKSLSGGCVELAGGADILWSSQEAESAFGSVELQRDDGNVSASFIVVVPF